MFDTFFAMFGHGFIVRALICGLLIALCSSLLGVSLVLKRYSMIGDGLSHVGFGALAVASAFNAAPLSVAIPVTLAAAFLLLRLSESSKIKGDAAIAMISSASLAAGVIVVSVSGKNTDLYAYLFGSILSVAWSDVIVGGVLSFVVITLYILFYNSIFAVTFDEDFAKASGIKTGFYNMLTAGLTALVVVFGMRMMGAMLISSLLVFPSLSAMRIFKSFRSVTVCAGIMSCISFLIGIILSYVFNLPAGAAVVAVNAVVFCIFALFAKAKNT